MTAEFIIERLPELWSRTGEHFFLTGVATSIAIVLGIPIGILCLRIRELRGPTLSAIGILQTIPSLAMLAILLSLIGKIGALPAIIALTLYALLPIVRNTLTGLDGVPDSVLEAARGVGMSQRQTLWIVQFPLALPTIVAGIRTAAVIGVGIATLSAFIGAGGLGQFINRGLALNHPPLILLGAIPAAILALLVDFAIWAAEWSFQPVRSSRQRRLQIKLKPVALAIPVLLLISGVLTASIELPIQFKSRANSIQNESTIKTGTLVIGSKEFAEQLLLSEIMAQMIEQHTDLEVMRKFGLGGTMICHEALVKGEIDLYPEYTGTGYRIILQKTDALGSYVIFNELNNYYREQFRVEWLEPFGFNNTYAITVRKEDAQENNWKTISDLEQVAKDMRAGFTSEFQERQDGYPGLQKAYGYGFGSTQDLSPALMCEALLRNEVDVICAFATDGKIAAYDLFPLKDDRKFFPPYDAAPVIRNEILQKHPEIRQALAPLAGLLNNETMQRLNYQVEGQKQSPSNVAQQFLVEQRLIDKQ